MSNDLLCLFSTVRNNLLGISQLCDKDNNVTFDSFLCRAIKLKNNQTRFTTLRSGSNYSVNFNKLTSHDICILSEEDES